MCNLPSLSDSVLSPDSTTSSSDSAPSMNDSAQSICDSAPSISGSVTALPTPSISLLTGKREVGSVYVSQTREGDSMVGVEIKGEKLDGVEADVTSYIGFKVCNDSDPYAPDYRLYCDDGSGNLLERGELWKVVTGVEKRRSRPNRDRPVTTLYIRITGETPAESDPAESGLHRDYTESGESDSAESSASGADSDSAKSSCHSYYIGKMKDLVSAHPSGSGLMGDSYPSFGVFERYFGVEEKNGEDTGEVSGADSSESAGYDDYTESGDVEAESASDYADSIPDYAETEAVMPRTKTGGRETAKVQGVAASKVEAPDSANTDEAFAGDERVAAALAGSITSDIFGKSLASRRR